MTRRHKSTKADKKSRSKKNARSHSVHDGRSTADVGVSSVAGGMHLDAVAEADAETDADADADAEWLLRRPPKRRAGPIGPALGERVEASADSDRD